MLNNYVNFYFSIMKKIWGLANEKLLKVYKVGMEFWMNIHGCYHTLEMAICALNQLKN